MKAMEHEIVDLKMVVGLVLSFVMTWIGQVTLSEWATFGAIITALSTTVYTCIKIYKELKNKKS